MGRYYFKLKAWFDRACAPHGVLTVRPQLITYRAGESTLNIYLREEACLENDQLVHTLVFRIEINKVS